MNKKTKIIIPLLLAFVLLAAVSAPVLADTVGRTKGMMMGHKKMTFNKADMEAKMAEMKVKQAAVDKALADNNYNAWVTAVTAINAKSPILQKINATNFPKLVEIYNLQKQLEAKTSELGIKGGMGMMVHGAMGFGHGIKK